MSHSSRIEIEHGDCRVVMRRLASEDWLCDAIVTDPPYHLASVTERLGKAGSAPIKHGTDGAYARAARGFMGKQWDGGDISFDYRTWQLALMVLKPGGYLLAFGGTRTFHKIATAIEAAGAELRDTICWLYGSGMPKSHNQRGDWKGWGSALKPAWEPIIVAQRPTALSIEDNLARHGVGAINIEASRVPVAQGDLDYGRNCSGDRGHVGTRPKEKRGATDIRTGGGKAAAGRWPANVIHDGSHEVLEAFAAYGADKGAAAPVTRRGSDKFRNIYGNFKGSEETGATFCGDAGSAARFFYCAKASRAEREAGLDESFEKKPLNWSSGDQTPGSFQSEGTDKTARNNHPTVKPTALMRYLCALVTPPSGIVLDPFAGSGSTGRGAVLAGLSFFGIDQDADYVRIARARIADVAKDPYADGWPDAEKNSEGCYDVAVDALRARKEHA